MAPAKRQGSGLIKARQSIRYGVQLKAKLHTHDTWTYVAAFNQAWAARLLEWHTSRN